MITRNTLSALVLLPLFVLGIASASPAPRVLPDNGQTPVVVLPTSSTIAVGDPVTVTVTISGTTTADQVVNISSNSSCLPVPSTVTVLAGHNSASFTTYSTTGLSRALGHGTVGVTITASCNNGSTYGYLTVTY